MKPLFLGTGTALVTPFRNDSVDWEAFEQLIEEQINGGVTALIAAGTTGEPSTMTWDEQLKVIRFVCDKAAGRACVIAGTGSNNTAHAIEMSRQAQELGVDALLVVTPYYNKTSQKGLIEHYTHIADNVDLPIILYNVPSRTGVNLQISHMKAKYKANWGKAECLLELGKLEDAKDIYLHLHQRLPYDGNITERIEEVNNRLVSEYERRVAENPEDFELCMDYAWSCLQRREYDKVREIMEKLPQPADAAQRCDLNNFATKFHINCDEYEKALSYAMDWEEGLKELPEGETEKEKKRTNFIR